MPNSYFEATLIAGNDGSGFASIARSEAMAGAVAATTLLDPAGENNSLLISAVDSDVDFNGAVIAYIHSDNVTVGGETAVWDSETKQLTITIYAGSGDHSNADHARAAINNEGTFIATVNSFQGTGGLAAGEIGLTAGAVAADIQVNARITISTGNITLTAAG